MESAKGVFGIVAGVRPGTFEKAADRAERSSAATARLSVLPPDI
jgi:hypothetical protein